LSIGKTHQTELDGSNGPGRSDEKAAPMTVDLVPRPYRIHISSLL
jgi:hypothetical protein